MEILIYIFIGLFITYALIWGEGGIVDWFRDGANELKKNKTKPEYWLIQAKWLSLFVGWIFIVCVIFFNDLTVAFFERFL